MNRFDFRMTIAVALAAVGLLGTGCEEQFSAAGTDPDAFIQGDAQAIQTSKQQFNGAGVGAACKADGECRSGLKCASGKCAPSGAKKADESCVLSAECEKGLQCGFFGFCVPSGGAANGEECTSTADCVEAHFCLVQGISGLCTPANGKNIDVGQECASTEDCLVGLKCSRKTENAKFKCQPGSITLNPDLFAGAVCPELEEADLPFQARILVPRTASTNTETATACNVDDCCDETAECGEGFICKAASKEAVQASSIQRDNTGEFTSRCCRARLDAGKEPTKLCRVQDFYSTPFPNDSRIGDGGKVDMSAHPIPGPGIVGLDLAGNVVKALSNEMKGFSVAPSVMFRFTRPLDETKLTPYDPAKKNPASNTYFVNLDTGEAINHTADFKPARNKFICANWLVLQSIWGAALHGNTTYGVVVTDGVRAKLEKGEEGGIGKDIPTKGDDLEALLGATEPKDADVKRVWGRYAKLRAFLAKNSVGVAGGKVVAATVFTTQDVTRTMRKMRAAAYAAAAPKLKSIVSCTKDPGKTAAGCESRKSEMGTSGSDARACPKTVNPNYHEFHARISVPVWQTGTRPYLIGLFGSKGGGAVSVDAKDGVSPVINKGDDGKDQYEDVCVGFAIPKGTMPKAGWPVLVYGHGTGGSHRSGITQMAKSLSVLKDPAGKSVPMAIMGWDQPMHGPRRFPPMSPAALLALEKTLGLQGTPIDPGPLFYNFANPPAAKGNFYQGSADLFTMVRWAKTTGPVTVDKVGNVDFDPKRIYYMGHSQGGTTGPLGMAWEEDVPGAVFSGTGGGLVFSLLNKKSPKDATVGVQIAIQESDLDEFHPVLGLMQYYFDEVDPLAYGPLFYEDIRRRCGDFQGKASDCSGGVNMGVPKHILHTFGTGDSYTPPQTSAVFAASTLGRAWFDEKAKAVKLKPHPVADLGMKTVDKMPAQGNLTVKDGAGKDVKVTGISVIIKNRKENSNATPQVDYDGHFVAFKDKLCHKQVTTFLATIQAGVPSVPDK